MSDTAVVLMALGILLVVGVGLGGVAWFISSYHGRASPSPAVSAGPQGPVAQIPTKQVSVIRSGLPWLALGQYAVAGTLTVGPDGVAYTRPLRRPKHHTYAQVRQVQAPDSAGGRMLRVHFTNGWGIAVITGTPEGRHVALTELSRWCRVTA